MISGIPPFIGPHFSWFTNPKIPTYGDDLANLFQIHSFSHRNTHITEGAF